MTNSNLNPHYTFDNFVVGNSNSAAISTIALISSKVHNPLYVYGAVGTGKTHLLHAIGNSFKSSTASVCYRTTEDITDALIHAYRTDTASDFRAEMEAVDLLLIDDIHLLAGKERTQQEYLQIFESMSIRSKQIVVVSDRSPKESKGMDDRIIAWFEGGTVICLNEADLGLKTSILKLRAKEKHIELLDNVAAYIASACSTVRELDCAFNRVFAELSFHSIA